MKIKKENIITIEVTGEDAYNLKSALKKISEQESECRFKVYILDRKEHDIIKNISKEIEK